jgi:galactokinase
MIDIKIEGIKYQLPKLSEISISRFVDYLEFIDDYEPEEDNKDLVVWLNYYTKHIAFWTGAEEKLIRKCKAEDIAGVYAVHQNYLAPVENTTFNCFELSGELYYLPQRFMQNSTIEDFAEANEYEKQLADVMNGQYKALPKVAAVLCRKEGEGFDDYKVEERAKLFESMLNADDLFQVGFFLLRQSEKLQKDLQIYTTSQTLAALKQVSKI